MKTSNWPHKARSQAISLQEIIWRNDQYHPIWSMEGHNQSQYSWWSSVQVWILHFMLVPQRGPWHHHKDQWVLLISIKTIGIREWLIICVAKYHVCANMCQLSSMEGPLRACALKLNNNVYWVRAEHTTPSQPHLIHSLSHDHLSGNYL